MAAPPRRGRWIGGLVIVGCSALILLYASLATDAIGQKGEHVARKVVLELLPSVALLLGAMWWPRFIGWLILVACALLVAASVVLAISVSAAGEPGADWIVPIAMFVVALPAFAGYLFVSSVSAKPKRSA